MGSPQLKSIKALAIGPENILFIGDNDGMKVVAIDLGDDKKRTSGGRLEINKLDSKLADMFGANRNDIRIQDLIVSQYTAQIFLSVSVKIW